ncbi:MAG TPA: DNA polymerase III subunit gamma/tau [Armatimonadota bacterium]
MSYVSLYRKYRSQGFDEVLGQRHVTQTLKNALAAGRVPHAYLFTGPRGTGKTSTARILAKALNCTSFDKPTPDPCGHCEACIRIRDGSSMDVMEIDAASTRGIDDMRELRERVKYAPAEERYKVYIVDEVHQLSGDAFNAFLKTLEEPPANVIFVLATTEVHKVPATILSRCQRFDFRRGGLADLKERIETVCKGENWSITPEAVTALAVGANGGYRDALSLLEQVAAYTSGAGAITLDDVGIVLGSMADEQLLAAVDAVIKRDPAACFKVVDEALAAGVEVRQFITGLRRRFRDLLMIAVGAVTEDSAVVASQREHLQEQAKALPQADCVWCIDQLNEAERDLRWSPQQRLLLETTLVRLATRSDRSAAAPQPSAPAHAAAAVHERPAAAPAPRKPAPHPQPPQAAAPPQRSNGRQPTPPPSIDPPDGEIYHPTPDDLPGLADAWARMVAQMKGSSKERSRGMSALRVERGMLIIGGPIEMWVDKSNELREKIQESFAKAYGKRVPLRFIHVPVGPGDDEERPPEAPPAREASMPSLEDLAGSIFDVGSDDDSPNPFTE